MYVNQSHGSPYDYDLRGHHELHEGEAARTSRLVTFFISVPICLLAVLVDLLLAFIILRYKALKTRGNYYILNYCICNVLFLTSEHILHLSMDLFFGGYLEANWYCAFIQLENYFLNLCIIFVSLYTIDEYVMAISGEYFLYMYKNGYKYFIACFYPIHFILAFVVTNVCFSTTKDIRFHISFIFVTIVYAACVAVIVKIRSDCRKAPYKNNKYLNQTLSVTLFTVLFYLPVVFYYNVLSIVERIITDHNLDVLRSLAFIAEYFAYSATFVLLYKLYKTNKFYKLAIYKLLRKSNQELDFSRLDNLPQSDIDQK